MPGDGKLKPRRTFTAIPYGKRHVAPLCHCCRPKSTNFEWAKWPSPTFLRIPQDLGKSPRRFGRGFVRFAKPIGVRLWAAASCARQHHHRWCCEPIAPRVVCQTRGGPSSVALEGESVLGQTYMSNRFLYNTSYHLFMPAQYCWQLIAHVWWG